MPPNLTMDERLERAKAFKETFNNTKLKIHADIEAKREEAKSLDYYDLDFRDPQTISAELSAQVGFLRKLKYQYKEASAKDRYTKIIVSDEAPLITQQDNLLLGNEVNAKKLKVKEAKQRLIEEQDALRATVTKIEQDYNAAAASVAKNADLVDKIVDARLKLARLHHQFPPPRLTEAQATDKLAEQDVRMADLADQGAEAEKRVQELTEAVKLGTVKLDSQRMERREAEKRVENQIKDTRWLERVELRGDMFEIDKALFRLISMEEGSENEIQLKYLLQPWSRELGIKLVFEPVSRMLANIEIEGIDDLDLDLSEAIDAHVPKNDLGVAVAVILQLVRNALGES
ncbi:hypothetical protein CYLTODRAFT_426134 [Cylindrobasidium torrendii FP15055 ss-10]|uniref:Kinetochore protein Sos7 coiled-coil domain-containing protein n=1 Tax=Cylindrobasidium torrendii FP15055 ss-10 TaxID=1314674 RepID=A0A0D7AYE8_9AGAR|nr:hypothetical protein CYLTODRAFT_426134 [Cylindrobasidium torrendii FP15055 ss-10]